MKAVVDASVLVRAVVPGQLHHEGVRAWISTVTDAIAPALMLFEAVTAIRHLEAHRAIDAEVADGALSAVLGIRVGIRMGPDLHRRAYALARELGVSRAGDTTYLAVALEEVCPLFTLDERFLKNCVSHGYDVRHPVQSSA
ncbi:MAG: type II toxin-antitoxin system VapC family toxin [bacterium]